MATKPKPEETVETDMKQEQQQDDAARKATEADIAQMRKEAEAKIAQMLADAEAEISKMKADAQAQKAEGKMTDPAAKARADKAAEIKEAMKPTSVTIPRDRSDKRPHEQTVIVPGMPTYYAVIPRGVAVTVPYYVAEAVREDVLQNDKTEVLIKKLEKEYLEKAQKVLEGKI